MPVSVEDLGDALQDLVEQLNRIEGSLAKLGAGLTAVKAVLAIQMNPTHPKQALAQIEKLQAKFLQLAPNASQREKISEAIEILKLLQKHGPAKRA